MGILGFIKSQLIDIIEWMDNSNYTLVYKFPDEDHEVKNGAKLICRENQAAILINEGVMADIFGPGTHTLSTQNVPVLSRLKGWKYGFSSPFKVDVYYVNLKQYIDQKWGTANPMLIRDPEFAVGNRPGRVRIRAFGSYNFKISDPGVFFKELVGTQGIYTTDEIEGYLKRMLVGKFTQAAGKSDLSVADMAGHYSRARERGQGRHRRGVQKARADADQLRHREHLAAAGDREGPRRRRGPVGARRRQHPGLGGHAGDARRGQAARRRQPHDAGRHGHGHGHGHGQHDGQRDGRHAWD
jgi:hypothetical protein